MATRKEYASLLEEAMDVATAALSAAWPRSIEGEEIKRLKRAGFVAGATCDVDFSLSFDGPAMAGIALEIVRAAGFRGVDAALIERGFVVVRVPLRLSAFDLAIITLRLNRMVGPLGGYAAFIGPAPVGSEHASDAASRDAGWYRAAS